MEWLIAGELVDDRRLLITSGLVRDGPSTLGRGGGRFDTKSGTVAGN